MLIGRYSAREACLLFTLVVSLFKVLLFNLYRSTDFEVHRNWLAITHSLPVEQWYHANDSQWTLDYPPAFAYFEWTLSAIAVFVDPKMVQLDNWNYDSWKTVVFQRCSVIVSDMLNACALFMLLSRILPDKNTVFTCFVASFTLPGLIMVDNIHFQYNGFLFAFQILSIYFIASESYIKCAFSFSLLLNLKHIYLYIAPVYFVFLLKVYCFSTKMQFCLFNFIKLAGCVVTVFATCFAQFVFDLPQVLSRLFPFKRGLTHAYWAPNIWALYNTLDVALAKVSGVKEKSGFVSGVVDEHRHLVLPQVSPITTLLLTVTFIAIVLFFAWKRLDSTVEERSNKPRSKGTPNPVEMNTIVFLCSTTLVAYCSFLFGWHVHEKAVLLILVPFTVLVYAVNSKNKKSPKKSKLETSSSLSQYINLSYVLCLVSGTYSLFPLLQGIFETPVKLLLLITYLLFFIPYLDVPNIFRSSLSMIGYLYMCSFVPLFIFVEILCRVFDEGTFLPLLLTSLVCTTGILSSFLILLIAFCSKGFDSLISKPKLKDF